MSKDKKLIPYTPQQIEDIKTALPLLGKERKDKLTAIANNLGRTYSGVYAKLMELGSTKGVKTVKNIVHHTSDASPLREFRIPFKEIIVKGNEVIFRW